LKNIKKYPVEKHQYARKRTIPKKPKKNYLNKKFKKHPLKLIVLKNILPFKIKKTKESIIKK